MSTKIPSELAVFMHGQQIATLYREGRVKPLRLQYRDDLPENTTPLSVALPIEGQTHTGPQIRYWLAGLLPDREEVLAAWRRSFQVTSLEEFALLPHVGNDVAGAVQFCRPDQIDTLTRGGELIELTEEQVGRRLDELGDRTSGWGVAVDSGQFSLAGTQAKVALHFTGQKWFLPTGTHATTHIVKPAITGLPDQDLNEHLTMRTAANLGLAAAPTRIMTFAGRRALVVQRYDRLIRDDGQVQRIHQEDLVQALGRRPSDKYEIDGGPGLTTLVGLVRQVTPAQTRTHDVIALLEAAAFNWLIGGTDAHAKNYSLLLAGNQVRLAPLYDLNSFLPYNSRPHVNLSMSVGRHGRFRTSDITADDWRWVALRAGVDPDGLLHRITLMAQFLPDAAANAAAGDGIDEPTNETRAFSSRFVNALTDHAAVIT